MTPTWATRSGSAPTAGQRNRSYELAPQLDALVAECEEVFPAEASPV